MVIENKRTTIVVHLRKLLLLFLLSLVVVLLIYYEFFTKDFLGFDQKYLIIPLIAIYLLYYCWGLVRNYYYFYYSDLSPSKLVFKFYSLAPLSKRQNYIEIRKDEFYKYTIEEKWLGIRKNLILYQRTPKGIAKFKPISISLLKKEQIRDLTVALSYFLKES